MAAPLAASRLHAIVGPSRRLRDEVCAELVSGWSGPVQRAIEPADLPRLVLDLETPSLFGDPALWVVRAGGAYLKRHRELLAPLAGAPVTAGQLVLSLTELERGEERSEWIKRLEAAGALHRAAVPDDREAAAWLAARLSDHPQGIDRPRPVAEALVAHLGADVDQLLAAIDTVACYAGDRRIDVAAVEAVVGGIAERPLWEFAAAVLDGKPRRALELLHAAEVEPHAALSSLHGELRKLMACTQSADDAEVADWIGQRGRPNLYHARQRARALGAASIARLLTGCVQAQRQLRQTGMDPERTIELLVLHAQRVLPTRAV